MEAPPERIDDDLNLYLTRGFAERVLQKIPIAVRGVSLKPALAQPVCNFPQSGTVVLRAAIWDEDGQYIYASGERGGVIARALNHDGFEVQISGADFVLILSEPRYLELART